MSWQYLEDSDVMMIQTNIYKIQGAGSIPDDIATNETVNKRPDSNNP